jgi:hypothetical protein
LRDLPALICCSTNIVRAIPETFFMSSPRFLRGQKTQIRSKFAGHALMPLLTRTPRL